jgi:hypothetical protein
LEWLLFNVEQIARTLNSRPFSYQQQSGLEQGCQMVYFQTKRSQFGKILEGLAMVDVGIFYGHLVYFMVI